MFVAAIFGSKTRRRDYIAHHKFALHSEYMFFFCSNPRLQIQPISDLSIYLMNDSNLAFMTPKMIHLLDRTLSKQI